MILYPSHLGRGILIGLMIVLVGCTSRYRLDLFLIQDEQQQKVKVESTRYVRDALLGSPFDREKLATGKGTCMVIETGSRGETMDKGEQDIISWDRYVRFELYFQLPERPTVGNIPLANNSFAHLKGHFERTVEQKVYLAENGYLAIDSLTDDHLFATVDGRYENRDGESIRFQGQFKVKSKR